jgi:hypothetical protein
MSLNMAVGLSRRMSGGRRMRGDFAGLHEG